MTNKSKLSSFFAKPSLARVPTGIAPGHQRGFLLLAAPKGKENDPESLLFIPAVGSSEAEVFQAALKSPDLAILGIQSAEALRAQIQLVHDFAKQEGVEL